MKGQHKEKNVYVWTWPNCTVSVEWRVSVERFLSVTAEVRFNGTENVWSDTWSLTHILILFLIISLIMDGNTG